MIHFYRVKSFELYQQLSIAESGELLTSINYLKTYGFPKDLKINSGEELKRIWDLVEISQGLLNAPENKDAILNVIVKGLDPEHTNTEWEKWDLSGIYANKDQTLYYDPETGVMEKQVLGKGPVPQILSDNPIFKSVIRTEEFHLDRIKENIYIYKDVDGVNYRFIIEEQESVIQRQFNQEWYQAFSPSETLSLPIAKETNETWVEGGIFWASLQGTHKGYYSGPKRGPILQLMDANQNKPESGSVFQTIEKYVKEAVNTISEKIGLGGNIKAELVTDELSSTGMTLVDPSNTSFFNVLSRVEDPNYSLSFVKDGHLVKTMLPRLDLEFESSTSNHMKGKILSCKKLDGFGLFSGNQAFPLFGDFHGYLPLKKIEAKNNEENGVIVPFLSFAPQITDGLKTPTSFTKVEASWKHKVPYFFYKIAGKTLIPQVANSVETVQANVQIATIFLSERRYDEAAKYLDAVDGLLKSMGRQIDNEIVDPILNLVQFSKINQDRSPNASAIRLRAVAVLIRLANLHQIEPVAKKIKENIKEDFGFYSQHINRVDIALRIPKSENRLLSQVADTEAARLSEYSFPVSETNEWIAHPEIRIKGNQEKAFVKSENFQAIPHDFSTLGLSAGQIASSAEPVFLRAFPEGILPLYGLLENPENIGLTQRKKIGNYFGLDSSISVVDLKKTMITLLQLRYRYVIALLKPKDEKDKMKEEFCEVDKILLQSEINLVGALLGIVEGGEEFGLKEEDFKKHRDLAASLRTIPSYSNEIEAYDELNRKMSGDALKEALRLWTRWVAPNINSIPLSMQHASKIIESVVGPVLIQPLLELSKKEDSPDIFASSYAATLNKKPATIAYGLPLSLKATIRGSFIENTSKIETGPSPFVVPSSQPFVNHIFNDYQEQYEKFVSENPVSHTRYVLKDGKQLGNQKNKLSKQIEVINSNIKSLENTLLVKLNKRPRHPSQKMHTDVRIARMAARGLTINDAKTAIARGFDIKYLHALNPNLSVEEIGEIFEIALTLMGELRESQTRMRAVKAIDAVLKGDPSSDDWQISVEKLIKVVNQKNEYDPYDYPILLLAETEFNISLWQEQIPAITRLAPRKQVSALVELAMGLGKTDVISPAVLNLLADGKTLPILVMPEALLPSVAGRLQERMGQISRMEIRTIPIEREAWNKEKIEALKDELVLMMEQRIPLVWSSTDIQTLINSYIESLEGIGEPPGSDDLEEIAAWQHLFHLMRSSAEILGDEIHAILDILTSYNFSLGTSQQLPKDEMDAVSDFIQVIATHPEIMNKVSLPFFKGGEIPLTEEYFNKVLAPKIISTLIERGITNDPRCKEMFQNLDSKKIRLVREYLSSVGNESINDLGIGKMNFLPIVDNQLISRLASGKKMSDTEFKDLLHSLPFNDQRELRANLQDPVKLARQLTNLNMEYRLIDKRVYNFLAAQKEMLRTVFSLTAIAQIGKHYVLNKQGNSAIPADNGTPLWDSQFGSSLERMLYTSFWFLQQGISKDLIRTDLHKIVEAYRKELAQGVKDLEEGEIDLDVLNNDLTKAFEARYGTTCHLKERGFSEVEIDQLTDWINAKPERQMPLIRDYIFTEQKVYQKEIETSTHMFPAIAKPRVGLKGTTGILYNRATYPTELSEKPFISDTIPLIVQRIKGSGPDKVVSAPTIGTPAQILEGLYASSTLGPGSVIDTTGYLKKEDSETYARVMVKAIHEKNPLITGVVYYDGDIPKVIRLGIEKPLVYNAKMPPESLACLWDVAHNVGSNILINPSAHALFVVGKHTRIAEFLQASMRLRGLGAGQKIEIVTAEEDRKIIVEKLSKYFRIAIKNDEPLTIDQVIQYALLNEILEETGNNWRAIDMRMRMAVLNPILGLLWDISTSPQDAAKIFKIVKELFLKNRNREPWDQYGRPILKVGVQVAMKSLLNSWVSHPVLQKIKNHPSLFPHVNVETIVEKLKEIAIADPGPLQSTVDSESYLGQKQRTREKVQAKVNLKTHVKTHTRHNAKEQQKLFVKKRERTQGQERNLPPLRRNPYPPQKSIPLACNLFTIASHDPIPLKEAMNLNSVSTGKRGGDHSMTATELLSLDPPLMKALQVNDPDLLMSLNLAPVWKEKIGVSPIYAPYYFFQKFASHALLVHDKKSNRVKLKLVDAKEAEAILKKLKEDRANPKHAEKHEVNLSLYHLKEDRMIASGAVPVNPHDDPGIRNRIIELTSQAKLLSGITNYTKEESEFLKQWLTQRNPAEILEKFVFQMALNREETLGRLSKSGLGKIFKACGIRKNTIDQLLAGPEVASVKDIHSLLFDRALSSEQWFETARRVKVAMGHKLKKYAGKWSNVVVPLLPLVFNILHSDGVRARKNNDDLVFVRDGSINLKAIQRRWLMNVFFPSIADEYGAWKTVAPQLAGKLEKPGILNQMMRNDLGDDSDLTYLQEAFKSNETPAYSAKATIDQLESMSELAHPIWGLPTICSSPDVGEFGKISEQIKDKINTEDRQKYDVDSALNLYSAQDHHDLAKKMGIQAIDYFDLPASLKALEESDPNYEFERLYGLYAFLSKQDLNPKARRQYALKILPRLFGDKLGKDMRFYAGFIPKYLTVSPEVYSEKEIKDVLAKCYEVSKRGWLFEYKADESNPSTYERSLALKNFAKDAPAIVANTTSIWMNSLLKLDPSTHSWIDMMLFQLLLRKESLIDHQAYSSYFVKSSSLHMEHAHDFKVTPNLSRGEVRVLQHWNLNDFDLYAEIGQLKTTGKSSFTPYEMAQKWTDVFKKAQYVSDVPDTLWHKVLGGISESVKASPPRNEKDKAALRGLLEVLDNYSKYIDDFEGLQKELGNIRLAADFSFELAKRKEFAFQEINNLPTRDEHFQRIYNYFIPNFLLTASEAKTVPVESISGFFTDLHAVSRKYPSFNDIKWKNVFTGILDSFTMEGTTEQRKVFMEWVGIKLRQGGDEANKEDFSLKMSDVAIISVFAAAPESIVHSDLRNYVNNKSDGVLIWKSDKANFIDKISNNCHGISAAGTKQVFAGSDFDLFAELFELKTDNRAPLPYDDFAKKITSALGKLETKSYYSGTPEMIGDILATIADRATKVKEGQRDKAVISNLIKSVEEMCEQNKVIKIPILISTTNRLRLLSDFSDHDGNVNLENAVKDLFKTKNINFHANAIFELILELRKNTKDNAWLKPVFSYIVKALEGEVSLSYLEEFTLYHLFYENNRNQFPSLLNEILPTMSKLSIVINLFLDKIKPDFSKINHDALKSYFDKIPAKREFFDSLVKNQCLCDIADGDFDVLSFLGEIKTLDRPQISLQVVINSVSKYLDKTNIDDSSLRIAFEKLKELNPSSQEDRTTISMLIKKIDNKFDVNWKYKDELLGNAIHTLRMKVDFTGSPKENISKAFSELLNDGTSIGRRDIYSHNIIPKTLFPAAKNDRSSLVHLFEVLGQFQGIYYREGESLLLRLMNQDDRMCNAAVEWLGNEVIKSGSLPPAATRIFFIVMSSLDYSLAERIWKKMEVSERKVFLRLRLDHIPSQRHADLLTNLIGKNHFSFLADLLKLSLNGVPKLMLLNLLIELQPLVSKVAHKDNAAMLCDLVVKTLPKTFWGNNAKLSKEEEKELKALLSIIETTSWKQHNDNPVKIMQSYV